VVVGQIVPAADTEELEEDIINVRHSRGFVGVVAALVIVRVNVLPGIPEKLTLLDGTRSTDTL